MEKFAKLASLGAVGVAGGSALLYPLLVWLFAPTVTGGAPGARGGMDHTGWLVLTIAMLVPIAVLAGAHVVFAKQLKDGPRPI